MSQNPKGKEALFGRAVVDPEFRKQLLADPEGTIAAGGYEVDAEVLQTLKDVDPAEAEAATRDLDSPADRRAAS